MTIRVRPKILLQLLEGCYLDIQIASVHWLVVTKSETIIIHHNSTVSWYVSHLLMRLSMNM